jgi:hypothetical protein
MAPEPIIRNPYKTSMPATPAGMTRQGLWLPD